MQGHIFYFTSTGFIRLTSMIPERTHTNRATRSIEAKQGNLSAEDVNNLMKCTAMLHPVNSMGLVAALEPLHLALAQMQTRGFADNGN